MKYLYTLLSIGLWSSSLVAQFQPKNLTPATESQAKIWVDNTYNTLSQDEKLGQLFIVALYTNKGENHIQEIRDIVNKEKIGGLILMQDDAEKHVDLVNEFQSSSKIPMMIGMDAEWGIYQRIAKAYKYPWSITLGAIKDKNLLYKMGQKIADDCKRLGVNWDFAPVVDVNTNPKNPIIGNRSFGSDVPNVISSGLAYANGLQESNVLAAIKHFPGHGDTDIDSHLDLPKISHDINRLNSIELAPFKALMDKKIGGVMVAHLYVPALEKKTGIPASVSYDIVTELLKKQLGYKGLIITDALNMGAVANKYKPGELDALAFKAGNDIMLFSQGVAEGKKRIQLAIDNGEISKERLEESVKKILLTKYYLGLTQFTKLDHKNILRDINNDSHQKLVENLYSNAITAVKNNENLLPLRSDKKIYYIPLEEAPYQPFLKELQLYNNVVLINKNQINKIPKNSTVVIGLHKDNSTAYKPYKISEASKKTMFNLSKNHKTIVMFMGSPYALLDVDTKKLKTIVIGYENNDASMTAMAKAITGNTTIDGQIPVSINEEIPFGKGITITASKN